MWKPNSKIRIQISLEHFVKHLMGTNLFFSKTSAKIVVEARGLEPFSPHLSTLPTIHPLATHTPSMAGQVHGVHGSHAALSLPRVLSLPLDRRVSLSPLQLDQAPLQRVGAPQAPSPLPCTPPYRNPSHPSPRTLLCSPALSLVPARTPVPPLSQDRKSVV